MRILITLIIFFVAVPAMSQDEIQDELQGKNEQQEEKLNTQRLKKMAHRKALELQEELNLTNFTGIALEKAIYKYSVQANKVIQSAMSEREKTKSLSNIVYFQNEAFKNILTVHQFYQYLDLNKKNNSSR